MDWGGAGRCRMCAGRCATAAAPEAAAADSGRYALPPQWQSQAQIAFSHPRKTARTTAKKDNSASQQRLCVAVAATQMDDRWTRR